jgi:hypothetical protein
MRPFMPLRVESLKGNEVKLCGPEVIPHQEGDEEADRVDRQPGWRERCLKELCDGGHARAQE